MAAAILAASAPVLADQPLAAPPPTVCSLSGAVCATRDAAGVAVWRKLPDGRRQPLWRAATRATSIQVADDGRSLVAVQLWANLVEEGAGPGMIMLVFHRPAALPARVTLGEMIRDMPALPRTVSHRHWAKTLGYDGRGHFRVDTVENRRLLFDPATGRPLPPCDRPAASTLTGYGPLS